ncbi:RluA family pseudouridine synthase [Mycoplasmoides gallisepticum]|uniref:Pseudouridine synthase n=1 Tax=Mycoplasmoides gallisepticum WI01_2001.043-13-2P TaxID=1159201 RepID=J3T9A2_MYCGL|nr:RluA family pseudouridine synthase [Mycoplasmoides gallisepticum]AFP76062.1 RNA pseudouridine synthase [Mycoplasmoides gallisepticum VA94_7994-1-7P]AFP76829.1 RNA pseudouridine synthase [Mycoplasmoides gallisepticum NC95_13295-2-2P]AFP77583.1 RNA pseudouridine synthase [Mycoplasmoides gallisepticum NC96_1596-4-2P]AFP78354.1 RNA pseudouridine synthase [Mycoplasmoides gallisepticum NY01_2001.047-5-1P]AFP79114.1 RNA pseudouridine synthase [Mycoplasmoides gallisepticum WI01_2001.043-13-2P]
MKKTIVIKSVDDCIRIDKFLFKYLKNYTRTNIYKMIRKKDITVNNQRIDFDYILRVNDKITYYDFLRTDHKKKVPEFFKAKPELDLIYEDENLVIFEKPLGIPAQQTDEPSQYDHMQNRLVHYLVKSNQYDYLNNQAYLPSIVNRLDTYTTGIMLGAKNLKAQQALNQIIKNRDLKKFYHCLVHGEINPKKATLTAYLTKDPNRSLVSIQKEKTNDNKIIITRYQTLYYFKKQNYTLLDVELITGRTHQIRAHLASINHPVVGDYKYAKKQYQNNQGNFKHQLLHSYKIIFDLANYDQDFILKYLDQNQYQTKSPAWFHSQLHPNPYEEK